MSGNSWQQPVATEPTWGSPHTHIEEVVNTDPVDTNDHTITCSNLPQGVTGIYGRMQFISGTAQRIGYIKDASANVWAVVRNYIASLEGHLTFMVPLNSSKQFIWSVNQADVTNITITICAYWL